LSAFSKFTSAKTDFEPGKCTLICEIESSSSDRFDGADRLATSVVSVDEWLAFGDEFRRKDEGANCEILLPRSTPFAEAEHALVQLAQHFPQL
jgi:hypothetical protein